MLLTAAALLLLHAAPVQDTAPTPATPAVAAGAYRDPTARELVRRAREYRAGADRSLRGYQALGRQRTSAGLRTVLRERTLWGQEIAARIDWRREGTVRVELVGARTRSIGDDDDDDSDDVRSEARELAFDPADDRMRMALVGNDTWIRHPLAVGSERDYRFTAGDTLTVRLSGGETVRVFELRVEPRRLDAPLVSGSIWLEDRSYGVVRTLLRLSHSLTQEIRTATTTDSAGRRSRNVNVSISGDSASGRGRRRGGRGMWLLPDVRIDVRYITTEYGLVQGRWWMPTNTAIDATVTAGGFSVPARFERSWSQYRVEGDPLPAPGSPALAVAAPVPERPDTPQACREKGNCSCTRNRCREVEVIVPTDTAALAASPDLPPPLTTGAPLLSGKEVDDLGRELSKVASDPWVFSRPNIRRAPVLLRFNRVEGLSVGARQTMDFGPIAVDGTLRIATASWEPDVELGVRRETAERRLRLAAYLRLAAANPAERPLGFGNSVGALLWGRDNGDYFRATGVELRGAPPRSVRPWMEWRLFGEHQSPVFTETDLSLRGIGSDFAFRPNIVADRADQFGVGLVLRPLVDRRALGFRWGTELGVQAEAGTFRFARPSLRLNGALPLGPSLAFALDAAAGTSFGVVPVQSLWRLGGAGTLRGYDGSTAAGTAFWRGRGEVGRGSGTTRLALFSDVGWAGNRDAFTFQRPLWSVGAGVSVLDGLLRVDLARALRQPTGWRLELYMDGAL
jgi:hypothetical protein